MYDYEFDYFIAKLENNGTDYYVTESTSKTLAIVTWFDENGKRHFKEFRIR